MKRFLAIGECMVEMSQAERGLWRLGYAGDTFNTAWHARRALGEDWTVGFVSAVGDDRVSAGMLDFMHGANIDTHDIRRIPGASPGLYLIHLDGAERSFSYWRGQSAARRLAEDPDRLAGALAGADCLYFSGITLAILPPPDRQALIAGLGAARDAGAIVAFDSNLRPNLWADRREMIRAVEAAARVTSIALPTGEDEIAHLNRSGPEKIARGYRDAGVPEIVIKDGAEPALVSTPDGEQRVPAEAVAEPVDTTGAGDSFNGAYLAARLADTPPVEAARAAHRNAARVIGRRGALG